MIPVLVGAHIVLKFVTFDIAIIRFLVKVSLKVVVAVIKLFGKGLYKEIVPKRQRQLIHQRLKEYERQFYEKKYKRSG